MMKRSRDFLQGSTLSEIKNINTHQPSHYTRADFFATLFTKERKLIVSLNQE